MNSSGLIDPSRLYTTASCYQTRDIAAILAELERLRARVNGLISKRNIDRALGLPPPEDEPEEEFEG